MKTKTRRINVRLKGQRGERDAAAVLTAAGWPAKRDGQQGAGGETHGDLTHSLPFTHVECKRVEAFACQKRAMAQAKRDAGQRLPVVVARADHDEWLAYEPLDVFLLKMKFLEQTAFFQVMEASRVTTKG
jgi:hypothetical protein